ncbi:hypothetical protein FNF29_07127 [Cafeteria roenbergensis]|uniref:non-specific serine/threonine protein kinase n=1 Tax=Cafeteria roenbergensis TaxID=33653 RepID=A0A5A8C3X1_CAFRO|nr:hypothetical protein FNF29_07127 [Cafeteria roenbergensis]|eukprot:KAA0147782.1 hypothetical protein FNF29_07127 [Cafeteria roenbergensis]
MSSKGSESAAMPASDDEVGTTQTIGGINYTVTKKIADGGYGAVYIARDDRDGSTVVMKKMIAQTAQLQEQLREEVKLMLRLSRAAKPHPGIVRTIAARSDRIRGGHGGVAVVFRVVMEACTGGSLLDRVNVSIRDDRPIPDGEVLRAFAAIVSSTAYLHALDPPLAHRDLKLENVLVAADGSYRLCDFGSVCARAGPIKDKADRVAEEELIARFTTPHFRAPEMVDLYSGLSIDTRVDVWALGCVLFSLAYNKHPFPEAAGVAILAARYKVPPLPRRPQAIITLIRACLAPRPDDRPTPTSILAYCRDLYRGLKDQGPSSAVARLGTGLPTLATADGKDALLLRPEARDGPDAAPGSAGGMFSAGLPPPAVARPGRGRAAEGSHRAAPSSTSSAAAGGTGGGATRRRRARPDRDASLEERMRQMGLGTGGSGTPSGRAASGGASGVIAARRRKAAAAAAPPAPAAGGGSGRGDDVVDDEDDGFGFGGDAGGADDGFGDGGDAGGADDGFGDGGDDAFGFDAADDAFTGAAGAEPADDGFGFGDMSAADTGSARPSSTATPGGPGDDGFALGSGFGGAGSGGAGSRSSAPRSRGPASGSGRDDAFGFDDAPAAGGGGGGGECDDDLFGFDETPAAGGVCCGAAAAVVDAFGFDDGASGAEAGDEVADLFGGPSPHPTAATADPFSQSDAASRGAGLHAQAHGGGPGALGAGPGYSTTLSGASLAALYGSPVAHSAQPSSAMSVGAATTRPVAGGWQPPAQRGHVPPSAPRGRSAPQASTGLDALDPFG